MGWSARIPCWIMAGILPCSISPAGAQDRSADNAINQAQDAFGFSVGRESLGIYNPGNARGFSPQAAGNVRIDGLYFDPAYELQGTLVDSTAIKVGLSAQGYPFAAPSGIVDISLRQPNDKASASIIVNADELTSIGVEVDGTLPITGTLAVAFGGTFGRMGFPDGTDNLNHSQSLLVRWRPTPGIEVMPFWALTNDYDDESGVFFIPAGPHPPKLPKMGSYEGPSWADIRYTATNHGLLASARLSKHTRLRLGAFRSVNDLKQNFTNLLDDEQPDGTGERIVIVDPRAKNVSLGGELRLEHSIIEGPRLHAFYISLRGRDARREFGGSDVIDAGPGRLGEKVDIARPDFHFGETTRNRLRQKTAGIAYDGRWKNVGELSFGLSRVSFRKRTIRPDPPVVSAKSHPWLYSGTAAVQVSRSIIAYAGYSRGFEESGVAPPNAANRNEPLPLLLTEQKDAGLRVDLGGGVKVVGGVFDLTRPYFGYDSANLYTKVGTTRSRGAEFSVTGPVTSRLNLVAGLVLLNPKVTRDADVQGAVGSRPVGLPSHILNASLNWQTPWKGLDLDLALSRKGRTPSTTDNLVFVPPRPRVDLGTHYHFNLAGRQATIRVQIFNLLDYHSHSIAGSGIYSQYPGRYALGYLTIDF